MLLVLCLSVLCCECVVIQVFKHNTFNIERYHKIVVIHVYSCAKSLFSMYHFRFVHTTCCVPAVLIMPEKKSRVISPYVCCLHLFSEGCRD